MCGEAPSESLLLTGDPVVTVPLAEARTQCLVSRYEVSSNLRGVTVRSAVGILDWTTLLS